MTTFATGGGEETTRSSPTSEIAPGAVTNVRASKVVSANADAAAASATSATARQTASFDMRPPGCGEMTCLPYGKAKAPSSPQLPWSGVMLRRLLIAMFTAASLAVPAAAGAPIRGQTLMPGGVYSHQVEFTAHGPVVLNVVSAPQPTGLYSIRAALSQGIVPGRARLTDMEKEVSGTSTVVGINGDFFNTRWGTPSSILVRGGILAADAVGGRSAAGFDAAGGA